MSRARKRTVILLGTVILLAATLFAFERTSWDVALQDHFFDFAAGTWMVDRGEPVARLLFYDGPKILIAGLGLALLAAWVGPRSWRARFGLARRDLGVTFLTLLAVPLLIGWGKDVSNVFCPRQLRRYGGDVPYVRVFERYPDNDRPARRGRCFPAGHASGGFALIGLFWLRRSRRWRRGAVALTLIAGWAMGLYQMLNGAHFLSHTVTTMLLAVIFTLGWRLLIRERDEPGTGGAGAVAGARAITPAR